MGPADLYIEDPSESVPPRVEAPSRNSALPGRRSSRPIYGGPPVAVNDLPPHIPPMIIARAVEQKQQCSISFDDITNENVPRCLVHCKVHPKDFSGPFLLHQTGRLLHHHLECLVVYFNHTLTVSLTVLLFKELLQLTAA